MLFATCTFSLGRCPDLWPSFNQTVLIVEFSVVLYVLSDSPLSDVTFQTFSPSRGLTHRLSWGFVF